MLSPFHVKNRPNARNGRRGVSLWVRVPDLSAITKCFDRVVFWRCTQNLCFCMFLRLLNIFGGGKIRFPVFRLHPIFSIFTDIVVFRHFGAPRNVFPAKTSVIWISASRGDFPANSVFGRSAKTRFPPPIQLRVADLAAEQRTEGK